MYCYRQVTEDIAWIGGNDRRIALFENVYPVPAGMSYNAYFVSDEKTMVIDTVDHAVADVFFENIRHLLAGRKLDYLVVNHMEPDHAATIDDLVQRYPEVQIVCGQKAAAMMKQFFAFDVDVRTKLVKEGDTLSTGRRTFTFLSAPIVHWPEVMMTYETTGKILFSADAFGTFGARDGRLFADEVDFDRDYMAEARRYYVNIVGKYGTQVQAVLKKAAKVDIQMICPLHGFVWRRRLGDFIEKYQKWSTYTPEEEGVLIAYGSIYGNTANAAEILACKLAAAGKKVAVYDVSATDPSYIIAEAFRYSHTVFASSTYNAGIFVNMENLLHELAAHNWQNRTVSLVENGSWAASAGGLMRGLLDGCKNMTLLPTSVTLKSTLREEQLAQLDAIVQEILESMAPAASAAAPSGKKIEQNALFDISYGLFVLSTRDGERDNGCIINTVMQVTDEPKRIAVAVNKTNFTHDMICSAGVFNLSVLSTAVPFEVFRHFGFQSGRDTEKFSADVPQARSENGLMYLPQYTNAFISARVIEQQDCGTHTLFTAEITEARVLSDEPSATYAYYFEHIKPKPQPAQEKKKGFVCKICGYVYEGDTLPADFICPLCKHGAEDFEPLA